MQFLTLAIFTRILYATVVSCYFSKTHVFLGDLLNAETKSFPSIREALSLYIDPEELGQHSRWADVIKRQKGYAWSKHHHYIDLPSGWCGEQIELDKINRVCNNDCIFTSVLNITNDLAFNRPYLQHTTIVDNLKFLVHHLQDLHQPLHVYGDGRGGNEIRINLKYKGRVIKTNLHTLWDKYMPEMAIAEMAIAELSPDELSAGGLSAGADIANYTNAMRSHLQTLFDVSCDANAVFTGGQDIYNLDFQTYYNNNKDKIKFLFKNYLTTMLSTLDFIFGGDRQQKNEYR